MEGVEDGEAVDDDERSGDDDDDLLAPSSLFDAPSVPRDFDPTRSEDEIQTLLNDAEDKVRRRLERQLQKKLDAMEPGTEAYAAEEVRILAELHDAVEGWRLEYGADLEARLRGEPVYSLDETQRQMRYADREKVERHVLSLWKQMRNPNGSLKTAEEYVTLRAGETNGSLQMAEEIRNSELATLTAKLSELARFQAPTEAEQEEWGRRYYDNPRFFLDFYKPERRTMPDGKLESNEAYERRCASFAAVDA